MAGRAQHRDHCVDYIAWSHGFQPGWDNLTDDADAVAQFTGTGFCSNGAHEAGPDALDDFSVDDDQTFHTSRSTEVPASRSTEVPAGREEPSPPLRVELDLDKVVVLEYNPHWGDDAAGSLGSLSEASDLGFQDVYEDNNRLEQSQHTPLDPEGASLEQAHEEFSDDSGVNPFDTTNIHEMIARNHGNLEAWRNVDGNFRWRPDLSSPLVPGADPAGSKLKQIMKGEDGKTMGLCVETRPRPPMEEREKSFNQQTLSMLRLIDFCHHTNGNSLRFLDDFLDVLSEEIQKGFDLENRDKRQAITDTIIKRYGKKTKPCIAKITVCGESNPTLVEVTKEASVEAAAELAKKRNRAQATADEEDHVNTDLYLAEVRALNNRERDTVNVIGFNWEQNLLDLLSDQGVFEDPSNLVLNQADPFLPYVNASGYCDEILDGTWYSDSVERLKQWEPDPFVEELEFFMPIVLYVDKTGTTQNQRYPLEPFLFTTAIIRREIRNNPRCWRPAGFIPDLETKSSAEMAFRRQRNRGATAQSYHMALSYILKGFEQMQEKGIVTWLRLGSCMKKVRIRPEIAFVIGDGKSADMLTCRVPSSHFARRISRACCTLQGTCDRGQHSCQFLCINKHLSRLVNQAGMSPKEIQDRKEHWTEHSPVGHQSVEGAEQAGKVYWSPTTEGEEVPEELERPSDKEAQSTIDKAKKELDDLSFHPVRNAFIARCVRFGLDPRNIWGANPVDLMHAFQSGILLYLVKMSLDNLTQGQKVKLDNLVHKLFHNLRCHEKSNYPRLNFSKGFSKLSLLTSDEWAGKLFVLLLVLHTTEGRGVFKMNDNDRDDIECRVFGNENVDAQLSAGFSNLDTEQQCQEYSLQADAVEKTRPKKTKAKKAPKPSSVEVELENQQKEKRNSEDVPEEMLRKCSMNDFTQLAEALLAFHAWYKLGVHPIDPTTKKIDTASISASVQKMLAMVRFYAPRKKGNGWKLQKFHDLMHLAGDMERFGPPSNFDAGPHESGLRFWAKLPAMTSQTRGYNTFSGQVAARVHEFQCISKACRENGIVGRMDLHVAKVQRKQQAEDEPLGDKEETTAHGLAFRVFKKPLPNTGPGVAYPPTEIRGTQTRSSHVELHPLVENHLRSMEPAAGRHNQLLLPIEPVRDDSRPAHWLMLTECTMITANDRRDKVNRRLNFRCHPNFRGEGPWFDWAVIQFKDTAKKRKRGHADVDDDGATPQHNSDCVPCKILGFFEDGKTGEIKALVHGCKFRNTTEQRANDTCLIEFWQLQYEYRELEQTVAGRDLPRQGHWAPYLWVVSLDAIVARCFCIEENPGIHERLENEEEVSKQWVMMIRDRQMWSGLFT